MKDNVSFFAYFATIKQGTKEKMGKMLIFQIIYALLFATVFAIATNFNLIIFIIGFMAFFSPIPLQWVRTAKPNLSSLVPLSQRRRTVYNFLSIPVMFVFVFIIFCLVCGSIWLVSGLCVSVFTGNPEMALFLFSVYTEGLELVFADGYAVTLFISLLIFTVGAGTVYAHTDSNKYRNITAVALLAVSLAGAEALLQSALKFSSESAVHVAGYAGMYIKYLALPWLAVLLPAVVSVFVLAFGIYLLISKNKPKNY